MTIARPAQKTYGRGINPTVLSLVDGMKSLLDVGCGEGGWAPELRARGVSRLVGVEFDPATAAVAATRYDHVVVGALEATDLDGLGPFDGVIAADVLEHLVDPWTALSRLRSTVDRGARLIVSIPNARCVDLVVPLLLKGRFDYHPQGGLMDDGHLRWFTRRTLSSALGSAGWTPRQWTFVALGRRRRLNAALGTFRLPQDLLAHQLVVSADAS
jgi:2-polyprenyl-3-methyl-5-hydroxy-6-metoxy-1,4-benzoquinol methylase